MTPSPPSAPGNPGPEASRFTAPDAIRRATAALRRGALDEAESLCRQALDEEPDCADALNLLGIIAGKSGRSQEAVVLFARAVTASPGNERLRYHLGIALQQMGRLDAALESYDEAIRLKPGFAEAHNNRGSALHGLGRLDAAVQSYAQAIGLRPDFAEAHYNRGRVMQEMLRLDAALESYAEAIRLRPDLAKAFVNRGTALQALGRCDEALASFDCALRIDPASAEAHYNRGNALRALRRLDEALNSYDSALKIRPDLAEAHNNRGITLQALGRPDEALACYERAVAIDPAVPYLLGAWLHARMCDCDWADFETTSTEIIRAVEAGKKVASPFVLMTLPSTPAQQLQCARTFTDDLVSAGFVAIPAGPRSGRNAIRLGYFSSDFGEHPVSRLMAHLVESHDRSRFEVTAFSLGMPSPDSLQQRLRKAFDRFVDCGERSDREIAEMARTAEIDIAVDLNGHTMGARTGVFALRAAPIQVNYLGYPGTMGARFMDYIIADRTVIPAEAVDDYTERVIYLPDTFQVNDGTRTVAEPRCTRAELGLPGDGLVFCCFNSNYKITPDVFAAWMRLLARVPGSALWLLGGTPAAIQNLGYEARRQGIAPDRLVFAPRLGLAAHLARYRMADVFLDTWIYNGGTTVSDALWEGLPVLTCVGRPFAGRMAASLLKAIGLPELITNSHEEYEARALELAMDRSLLAHAREKIARHRETFPLFDTARFAKHLEFAYSAILARHRAGLPPGHLDVPAHTGTAGVRA